MKRKTLIITTAALLATMPLTAGAAGMDDTELGSDAQMALAANLSLQQASDLALAQHPGELAAIGYNDENGRGVFEATVIGKDGQPWLVKLDANTGDVLGQGLASLMDDEGDGEHNGAGKGETDGGDNDYDGDENDG